MRSFGEKPRDTFAMSSIRTQPSRRFGFGRGAASRASGVPALDSREVSRKAAMRVALVDPSLFTLPYDRMLALGLQRAGHDVVLHARALEPGEGEAGDVALAADFYRATGGARTAWLPRPVRLALKGAEHVVSMAALLNRLRRERPDVIHFQWLPLPIADRRFLPAFARIAPLVLTVHDSKPFNGDPAARLQRVGAEDCFGAFDRLIVHTERFRERLVAGGVPAERVARIPHGLLGQACRDGAAGSSAASAPDEAAAADVAAVAGPPPSTFLLFGQIKPYKGLDVLIEAFARLPEALRARARLRVVGKPHMDVAPLLELARERGVSSRLALEPRFVPEDEIPALFGPDTVAVFPYREIEASGALTLAVAHGRPVVASRIGAFAEELVDGMHGALVPPGDPAALAAAMERLLAEPGFAARCAAEVRALSAAMPSWDEIGRQTAAVYAAASGDRRAGGGSLRAPATAAAPAGRHARV
jgi:glycosyltransferase involved in cell wall biosynthesis